MSKLTMEDLDQWEQVTLSTRCKANNDKDAEAADIVTTFMQQRYLELIRLARLGLWVTEHMDAIEGSLKYVVEEFPKYSVVAETAALQALPRAAEDQEKKGAKE
jgi:hypothetical protein